VLPSAVTTADDAAAKGQNADVRESSRPLVFPAGFEAKAGQPSEGIKSGLAKLTERAVTKGDFNKMLAELSRPDRERAREFKGVDQGAIDAQIDKIAKQWKAKYGADFDLKDKDKVFDNRFQIIEGEVNDSAAALANWPVAVNGDRIAVTASGQQPAASDNKEVKHEARQEKLEKGRNVALVRFPAELGMPEMTVSMIHHLPAFWRIDIPNDRSGEQIYNDLLANLGWIADHSDRWPSNVEDAYRMVAAHAVAATYGIALSEHHQKG
jgi:hypothetical protein